jgi:hypothetical protein
MNTRILTPVLMLAMLGGCAPRLATVVSQGELLRTDAPGAVEDARVEAEIERARLTDERLELNAMALAGCSPAVCDAITRGEVVLGMTGSEVLAATRTSHAAWETRSAGGASVMTPLTGAQGARDVSGQIALVSIRDGRVASFTYREPNGYRTVSTPADASYAGRSAAQAEALMRQGDEYAAAGDLELALRRYDQADVLRPGDPQTTLRIATTLDKQLRPIEAIMRYRLFTHQLELELIQARGEAAARMAEAIARAHERIVVLERR